MRIRVPLSGQCVLILILREFVVFIFHMKLTTKINWISTLGHWLTVRMRWVEVRDYSMFEGSYKFCSPLTFSIYCCYYCVNDDESCILSSIKLYVLLTKSVMRWNNFFEYSLDIELVRWYAKYLFDEIIQSRPYGLCWSWMEVKKNKNEKKTLQRKRNALKRSAFWLN